MKINIKQKIRLILMGIGILLPIFLILLFPNSALARQGCCSWHGGVCGCRCCDGTPLSDICAPYYPSCNNPVPPPSTPTPTPTPEPPKPVCHQEKMTEEIPFETKHESDDNLEKGKTVVATKGQKGEKEKNFEICILNGQETSRKVVSENITKAAVNEIIKEGTKVKGTSTTSPTPSTNPPTKPPGFWGVVGILFFLSVIGHIFLGIIALITWAIMRKKS